MSLVVVVLLVALAVGALLGGSLERLGTLALRRWWLAVAAFGVQLLGAVVGGPAYPVGLVLSLACVLGFLAANRTVPGMVLVGLGLAANALVVGLNGAMPVSEDAARRAGVALPTDGADPRHEAAGGSTRLALLGDVVPLPLPLRPEVVSPGDVLVAAGIAQLVVTGMLRPLRPVPPLPERPA